MKSGNPSRLAAFRETAFAAEPRTIGRGLELAIEARNERASCAASNEEECNEDLRCVRRFPSGGVRGIRGGPRLFWVP